MTFRLATVQSWSLDDFRSRSTARVHLDLAAPAADSSDRAEQIDAFAERLTALAGHRLRAVKEDGYFVVMADPEGNEFCVD